MSREICEKCGGWLEYSGACARCHKYGPQGAGPDMLIGRLGAVGAVVVVLIVFAFFVPLGAWNAANLSIFAGVGAFMMLMAGVVSAGFVEA